MLEYSVGGSAIQCPNVSNQYGEVPQVGALKGHSDCVKQLAAAEW